MTDLRAMLDIAQQAVDLAAELVRTQAPGELTAKGDRDYASEVDYAVERAVRAFLKDKTPDVGFLGEEEGLTNGGTGSRWWTLDPVDGTVNFAHGVPLCGVSLALVEDHRPVVGVVDLPFLSARYAAADGSGASCNGQPVAVRPVTRLSDALVSIGDYAVGEGSAPKNGARLRLTEQLAGRALRVRMFGSAAVDLAWLASGRTDASLTLSNQSWDMAAGIVVAREAGARVVDRDGTDHTTDSAVTIAATPGLCDELVSAVADALAER